MKEIRVGRRATAIVDDSDYPMLSRFVWWLEVHKSHRYAIHRVLVNDRKHNIYMHRLILNAPMGKMVDHIDGNGLNNCRANIRLCTSQQNQYNRKVQINSKSGVKGVHWNRRQERWFAHIGVKGRKVYLGSVITLADAARAYNEAAIHYAGEFARLNQVSA